MWSVNTLRCSGESGVWNGERKVLIIIQSPDTWKQLNKTAPVTATLKKLLTFSFLGIFEWRPTFLLHHMQDNLDLCWSGRGWAGHWQRNKIWLMKFLSASRCTWILACTIQLLSPSWSIWNEKICQGSLVFTVVSLRVSQKRFCCVLPSLSEVSADPVCNYLLYTHMLMWWRSIFLDFSGITDLTPSSLNCLSADLCKQLNIHHSEIFIIVKQTSSFSLLFSLLLQHRRW